MSVFFIQENFTVGDIAGNTALLLAGARRARAAGAHVALSPELSLCGYIPEDLLYAPHFQDDIAAALRRIIAESPSQTALLVGLPWREDGVLYNACAVVLDGRLAGVHKKKDLPNYSVFDEKRYFSGGGGDDAPFVFTAGGESYAVLICQEIWGEAPARAAAENILVPNGSPYVNGKQARRQEVAAAYARRAGCRLFYANAAGGQDELVFDGASFVAEADGRITARLPAFAPMTAAAEGMAEYPDADEAMYAALRLGLRDYARKSGFADVLLGLSGGADSAFVAALAADALGGEHVTGVMMPTQYTSDASLEDAASLAEALGINYLRLPLSPPVAAAADALAPHLRARAGDVTMENLQARMRGTLLMALANNRDWLLLATGNKSEFACGYATLYGDMNGGFAPIKDVLKTEVWRLCRRYNARAGGIPERVITRAPSAELRAEQTDQDTLPPYEQVDAMLSDHLRRAPRAAMAEKYGEELPDDFYRRLRRSEYKRRQAPPGTKVSECAFGRDWRLPIANRYVAG